MSKETLKRRVVYSTALLSLLLSFLHPESLARAEENLPAECYASNGLVDLEHCSKMSWEIPLDQLVKGYYGARGAYVPGLPPPELHTFNPGNFLKGSATYTRSGHMFGVLQEKAAEWGLDPSQFIGAIATDSCAYVGAIAWIRHGAAGEWRGPYLVGDCAAEIHKFERACMNGTIIELDYLDFKQYQARGRLDDMQVYLQDVTNFSKPPSEVEQAVDYPSLWLQASGLECTRE